MEGIISVDATREELDRLKEWRKQQVKETVNKTGAETF